MQVTAIFYLNLNAGFISDSCIKKILTVALSYYL